MHFRHETLSLELWNPLWSEGLWKVVRKEVGKRGDPRIQKVMQ